MLGRAAFFGSVVITSVALSAACGTSTRADYAADSPEGGVVVSGSSGAPGSGIGEGDATAPVAGPGHTTVRGKTYAPNGTLPLAGVLVYETDTPPAEIPDHVYCDSCRVLPEGTFVQSSADGSFEFMAHAGTRYLVTEKGQFRRVRKIEISPDGTVQDVPHEVTTLPGDYATGAPGESDTIPKIAMLVENESGDNDRIQVALTALGITKWDNFDNDLGKVTAENLHQYHIALFPCQTSKYPKQQHMDAIRGYVQEGGKAYASDWSHAYVDGSFKEFFKAPDTTWGAGGGGGGEPTGALSPKGRYEDSGLSAWLAAVSPGEDPNATQFDGVWSTSNGQKTADVPDATGAMHSVTPRVFARVDHNQASFNSDEAATSLEFGCGRALLSIFHVHGGSASNLLMQEKALLYMLLDVSTCTGTPGRGPVN